MHLRPFHYPIVIASAALCLIPDRSWVAQELQPTKTEVTSDRPEHPEHGPVVTGEQATLPLVVVKGCPFVAGVIDGKSGDLMFDTGMRESLSINTHAISLPGGKTIGHGVFASGQRYDVLQFPQLDYLDLVGVMHFTGLSNILGFPVGFIEDGVDKRYIGSLGTDFFKGYVFKLDYAVPSVTFYRNDSSDKGQERARSDETVLVTIPASNDGHLSFPVTIRHLQATALLDAGSHAGLVLSPEEKSSMLKLGALSKKGMHHYTLSGHMMNGQQISPLRVEVSTVPSPIAKPGRQDRSSPSDMSSFPATKQYGTTSGTPSHF